MISYVLLISIAIAMSIGVFIYLQDVAKIQPIVSCKDGTSVIIENYLCDGKSINISIKNNGRFNIDGIVMRVSPKSEQTPTYLLRPDPKGELGAFKFSPALAPQNIGNARFTNEDINFNIIELVEIQPFILEAGEKIICSESLIKQQITNCVIK